MHVAFICSANMCRSVMAHAIMETMAGAQGLDITVSSGGTLNLGPSSPAKDAWLTCLQNDTPVNKMESTYVGDLPLDTIDLFFVMQDKHRASLVAKHGIDDHRIRLLGPCDDQSDDPEISDPIGRPMAEFEACHARLTRCIRSFLDELAERGG